MYYMKEFFDLFERNREQISLFLSHLKTDTELETGNSKRPVKYELDSQMPSRIFLLECKSDLLFLLQSLFWAGRAVNQNTIQLPDTDDKQRLFAKFCNEQMEKDDIESSRIYMTGKTPTVLLNGIATSLSILSPMD
jgi:hypothetical protein